LPLRFRGKQTCPVQHEDTSVKDNFGWRFDHFLVKDSLISAFPPSKLPQSQNGGHVSHWEDAHLSISCIA
jgi:exonuclease III